MLSFYVSVVALKIVYFKNSRYNHYTIYMIHFKCKREVYIL